jgi:SulP family sulfate permease
VLLAVVLTTIVSWAIGFERNQTVSVETIQDTEARTLVADYASTERAIGSLANTTARINQEVRALASAKDEARFAEQALLEADLRVLNREMEQRKLANNERQVSCTICASSTSSHRAARTCFSAKARCRRSW